LAANMDIAKNIWVDVVRRKVPPKFIDLNIEAFEKGYKYKL
jgi:indolepyruvate ferredoxin oxidoreductase beta subunit